MSAMAEDYGKETYGIFPNGLIERVKAAPASSFEEAGGEEPVDSGDDSAEATIPDKPVTEEESTREKARRNDWIADETFAQAKSFLEERLAAGPQPTRDLQEAGARRGLSKWTLGVTKRRLGIIAYRASSEKNAPWAWRLPDGYNTSESREESLAQKRTSLPDEFLSLAESMQRMVEERTESYRKEALEAVETAEYAVEEALKLLKDLKAKLAP